MTTRPTDPPANLDAERSILGAALITPASYHTAVGLVGEGDLYRHAHRLIWRAMATVVARGQDLDLLTVTAALREFGDLDAAGGPAYVAGLTDGVPRSAHVASYCSIVREMSARRDLAARAQRLADAAYSGADVTEARDEVRAVLDRDGDRADVRHELRVADELARERARREARRRLDRDTRGPAPALDIATLRDRLARPRVETSYRIHGWQPSGSRVMLTAAAKSGKTTMVGGLVRSLVDGDPWLGRHQVVPVDGTVAIIDTEMSSRQLDDWLRDQHIQHNDRVLVVALRGAVGALDLLDVAARSQWAECLRAAGVQYLIIDCLRPIMDALGLDEHRDAGRLLVAIDALLAEAGIPDACIVHHMGHSGERARGDSRLRDWPDVEWRIVRPEDDPTGARYVTAYGRDVEIPESRLGYDAVTRRLTIDGGSRRDAATADALAAVMDVLRDAPDPMSSRAIGLALADSEYPRAAVRDAIRQGVRDGVLASVAGPRRAILHRLSGQCAGVRHE